MDSKEFYKYMFREPGSKADLRDSAKALNVAIRAMRKKRSASGTLDHVRSYWCSIIGTAESDH